MKKSLGYSAWFVLGGLLSIEFTSGLSPSLRGKEEAATIVATVDLSSHQQRQRRLRSKASKSTKRDHGNTNMAITTSKTSKATKSAKRGRGRPKRNNGFFVFNQEQPAKNAVSAPTVPVQPATQSFVPANTNTLVPRSNNNDDTLVVPSNNNTLVPSNNTPPVESPSTFANSNGTDLLQPCTDRGDCTNNACGFETLNASSFGKKVCCPSNATFLWSYPAGTPLNHFCTQPLGAECSVEDGLCMSKICARDTCVTKKQPDGGSCDSPYECSSGTCARARAEPTSPTICCPKVVGSSLVFVVYNEVENFACANQPTGAPCFNRFGQDNDSVCASKVCVDKKCQ